MRARERFPRSARLRRSSEIRAVFREGRRIPAGPLELFVRPSPAGRPRLAFVVPLRGRNAVERNRLRRRLREVVRREWLPEAVRAGIAVDVAVRTRPEAYAAGFGDLRAALLGGLASAGRRFEGSSSD